MNVRKEREVPPRFSQQFKDEAVRMVLDGPRPITHVAAELSIHETSLGKWVSQYRASLNPGPQPGTGEPKTD
ncbi:transposase, partial [Streptomyces sp. NPDC005336]|uniref:transposase n=2 Tax=unclassified Streptomyces TaxID=2593676 RepID=UPI0033AAC13F